ncbi:YigZ family protein [Streptococcus chenjunshii]|uniref:YigZ family protein n=1 Tax=Streptococcus chenjunshii TaxID=2173853 RepID=A0A372KKD7_9STRE|nr:YigZ family protein [Streptococcus chenjunshii]AXQ79218.1 YigZ family protein [Streptococcus chenjunshii]RFU50254.1 YigZ family protein [Streptococcus chenjunshii]RFU52466.1 YigZ family protein [Streptococcus chenjunshii]
MTYKTIRTNGCFEEEIKKSRFICFLKRVSNETEAKDYIAQIKKEHYKANHSCSAMIIGDNSDTKRSSDDGEPSGTAGIPMLSVLEKQGLTNLVAVVTRYFGGVKLGTGGLIRAYSGTVSKALTAVGLVEVKELLGLEIQLTYSQYQTWNNFLQLEKLQEAETEFLDNVKTHVYIEPKKLDDFLQHLTDFYHKRLSYKEIGSKLVELPF